jgi:predicted acetyltransferase
VLTLERFRKRGLARALVLRALQESRTAGNDVTFLLANRDDWPKELYRKLGFDEIGFTYDFVIPPPT